jgi:hypothetical protein
MGDFERTFGAGADAVDIINGFCAQEAAFERRSREAEEIIEHRFWFPDYEAAERWADYHRGTAFKRVKRQGGYEVTVKDRRDAARKLKRSGDDHRDVDPSKPVDPYYLPDMIDHEVVHGDFRMRLARAGSPLLAAFLTKIRDTLPFGRAELSPVTLPLKELRLICKEVTPHICHDFDIGQGVFALFSADHHLLVGRRIGKDVEIWPWILEMSCGGGQITSEAKTDCFLCDTFSDEILSLGRVYERGDLYDDSCADQPRFVSRDHYQGGVRPAELGWCLSEWIGLLRVHDKNLNGVLQAPAALLQMPNFQTEQQVHIRQWCAALAWWVIAAGKHNKPVSVSLVFEDPVDTVFQTGPGRVVFAVEQETLSIQSDYEDEIEPIPEAAAITSVKPPPAWADIMRYRTSLDSSRIGVFRKPVCSHTITPWDFSAHERLRLLKYSTEFEKLDLPPVVREFVDKVAQDACWPWLE